MISYCSLTHTDSKRYHKHDTHWHILIYVCLQTGALYGFTCYPLHHHFDRFDSEQLKPPPTPGSSPLILKQSDHQQVTHSGRISPEQNGVSSSFCLAKLIFTKGPWKRLPFSPKNVCGFHPPRLCPTPTRSCVRGSDGVGLWGVVGRVGRWDGVRFNGSALHVEDQLVGDLGQYVFSQPSHAQHVVACAVHVVSERDKLLWHGTEMYKCVMFARSLRAFRSYV